LNSRTGCVLVEETEFRDVVRSQENASETVQFRA
jgi:hypothetical protein